MTKIYTYIAYFKEYLKYGDVTSVINSILYILTRRSFAKARIIKSGLGTFYTRKSTLDFQYINYAYELGVKKFIERAGFDVYIDAGACLGEFSVWLAKKGKRCIAFEPVKESYELIVKNVELNEVKDRVQVYNYGLGRAHSVEYFLVDHLNLGASKKVDYPTTEAEKFEINALDDVYAQFGLKKEERILIKIDVEGMEIDLIEGARKFLNHFTDVILVIEEKLTGEGAIRNFLNSVEYFEFGVVDKYNMYARKKAPK